MSKEEAARSVARMLKRGFCRGTCDNSLMRGERSSPKCSPALGGLKYKSPLEVGVPQLTTYQPDQSDIPLQPSDLNDQPLRHEPPPLPFSLDEHLLLPLESELQREQYPPEQADSSVSAALELAEAFGKPDAVVQSASELEPETEPLVPLDGPSEPLFDVDQLGSAEPPAAVPPSAADQVAAALAEDEAMEATGWTTVFDSPAEATGPVVNESADSAPSEPLAPEARVVAPQEPYEQAPAAPEYPGYQPDVHAAHVGTVGYPPSSRPKARRGLFARVFGGGHPVEDPQHGLVRYDEKPGLLRIFARRNYQREATLASMRAGFSDLSELMRDIRDGLHGTVERQAELIEHLKYLPVLAEQNQQSAQRLEEQSQAQAHLHAETVRALREQMQSQQVHQEHVGRVLSSMSRESRDQKRELDELEGRLQRMRESDEAIASNLMSVSSAVRCVSEHGSVQGELARRMQESFDERTRQLEKVMRKQAARQGFVMLVTMLIAVLALGAAAAAGYLYLKQTGAI